jgi:hypothetical protein
MKERKNIKPTVRLCPQAHLPKSKNIKTYVPFGGNYLTSTTGARCKNIKTYFCYELKLHAQLTPPP